MIRTSLHLYIKPYTYTLKTFFNTTTLSISLLHQLYLLNKTRKHRNKAKSDNAMSLLEF